MLEWMIMPYKRYADFKGRSRRKEYWSFVLLAILIYVVLGTLMVLGGLDLSALSNPAAGGQMAPPGPFSMSARACSASGPWLPSFR